MLSWALLFAVATFLLWGTTNFLIGYGEKHLNIEPKVFTAVMWTTMGVLGISLLAYLYVAGKLESPAGNIIYPVAAGLFLGIGILTFVFAMSYTDMRTGVTAAIATSNAVFTTLLAFALLREELTLKEWMGILTVVLGIIILRI